MKIYSDGTYQSPLFVNSNPVGGGVPAFVFEIKTTAPGETFTLPLELTGTYNFNWKTDDGQSEDITAYNQAEITRTFASAGTYICTITNICYGWKMEGQASRLQIYDIKAWGNGVLRLGNSGGYFRGATNLTVSAIDILDLTGTTNMLYGLGTCPALTFIPSITSWAFGNITNANSMLDGSSAFDQDLGLLDISSLTTAASMLAGTTLSTTNLSNTYIGWAAQPHQDNVTAGMGNGTYNLESVPSRNALIADGWTITDNGPQSLGADIPRSWFAWVGAVGIAGDVLTFPSGGSSGVQSNEIFTIGKAYQIDYTVSGFSGAYIGFNSNSDASYRHTSDGTYKDDWVCDGTRGYMYANALTATTVVVVNSIKEIL